MKKKSLQLRLLQNSNMWNERHSIWVQLLFCAVFTGLGLFFWLDFGLIPLIQVVRSRSWTAVPAVVTESFAEPHGRGGRVCVHYEYVRKNRKLQGTRYDFFHSRGSCGGGSEREKIIESHPAGKRIECLVDPDDPAESVVSRSVPWCAWTGILLPLIFVVIGICDGRLAIRSLRKKLKHPARK